MMIFFLAGEMFSMIPYVVDLSKKLVPGLWEKVQSSTLFHQKFQCMHIEA